MSDIFADAIKNDGSGFEESLSSYILSVFRQDPFFDDHFLFRNVWLSDEEDPSYSTETDILVLCQKGMFVFEAKDYRGKIYQI